MTYNADNQLLTWKASAAAAAQSVVHDADGNTTAGPLPDLSSPAAAARWASFGFDARNRLTSVTATGMSSTHTYNAENLRTSSTENGITSQWVLNPHGLSGLSEALVRVKGSVSTRYVYGLGLLYEEEEAATPVVRTYHFDRQGSTAALTATDGLTVSDRFEYAAYGERTYRTGSTGSTDTPFQFNGFFGVQTDASGLLYMRARYYNVETRRFQSADPMGFAESSNFYWFANADPVNLVDPFGLGASDGGGFWSGLGRVLGNTIGGIGRSLEQISNFRLITGAQMLAGTALSFVTGDIANKFLGGGSTLYQNGIFTNLREARIAAEDLEGRRGSSVTRVENRTFLFGLGDLIQILGEELGLITTPSLHFAWAVESTQGNVKAFLHSQGTSVGENGIRLMGAADRSRLNVTGYGGQSYIQQSWGLAGSTNIWRNGDPVPSLSPWNWGRWSDYTTFPGVGYGISNHDVHPYIGFSND